MLAGTHAGPGNQRAAVQPVLTPTQYPTLARASETGSGAFLGNSTLEGVFASSNGYSINTPLTKTSGLLNVIQLWRHRELAHVGVEYLLRLNGALNETVIICYFNILLFSELMNPVLMRHD